MTFALSLSSKSDQKILDCWDSAPLNPLKRTNCRYLRIIHVLPSEIERKVEETLKWKDLYPRRDVKGQLFETAHLYLPIKTIEKGLTVHATNVVVVTAAVFLTASLLTFFQPTLRPTSNGFF